MLCELNGSKKKGGKLTPKTKTSKKVPFYTEECQHPQWVLKLLAEFCVHFWLPK